MLASLWLAGKTISVLSGRDSVNWCEWQCLYWGWWWWWWWYRGGGFDGTQAHGAEILSSKYSITSDVSPEQNHIPLSTDPRWLRFLAALSDKGYFKVSRHLSLFGTSLIQLQFHVTEPFLWCSLFWLMVNIDSHSISRPDVVKGD